MNVYRCFRFDFQFFAYLTLAAASLLIVLRMYVLCNLAMRLSIAHAYRQHRHMEQAEVYHGDRGWRMGDQCWVPHRRYALSSRLLHIISIWNHAKYAMVLGVARVDIHPT
jgi:hypothetical protein